MEGNFGGGKPWRMTVDSPNLSQPNFIQLKEVSRDKIYVDFKVQPYTPAIVQDKGLPELTSSLSNFVPSKAIELANTEIEKVKNKGPRGARSAPYFPLRGFRWVNELQSMGVTAWLASQICCVA